jgi:hypothetical protein
MNLGTVSDEPWGKVPAGFFHHGEKKCRKVIKEHVS